MCLPQFLSLTLMYRPYTTWLDFVLAQPQLPLAISTSYGDDEQTGMCPLELTVDTVSKLNNSTSELCPTCMRRLCSVRCAVTFIMSDFILSDFAENDNDRCSWHIRYVFLWRLWCGRWRRKPCHSTML